MMKTEESVIIGYGIQRYMLKEVRKFLSWDVLRRITKSICKDAKNLLMIGIGGSALGPQLLVDALQAQAKKKVYFLDNTDPDGIDRNKS